MYKITAKFPSGNDLVIYDPVGTGALPILDPKQTEELNQPGSLTFTLLYPHRAYGLLDGMKVYISAEKEGEEIFYGRVLDVEPDELTGQEAVTCEGALSFLNDGFLAPDPKNSSGTIQSQTMTAEAFFNRCIDEYNDDIDNDPRRIFHVGTVSNSRKDETRTYQITQFTSAKEAIEQNLLNNYGGFLKVYRDAFNRLMIDWVDDYGVIDSGLIELGENVISQSNRLSGENMFTAIRPVGKDGLVHSTTPVIDIYTQEEMAEYGRIVKNVDFPNITTQADLLAAGQALAQRINKTIYISSEISLLDLHFVDEDEPEVKLGNRYTNISGLEGFELTVSMRSRDYDNPQNDSISLKNDKHLEGNGIDDFRNDGDTISKRTSGSSNGVGMALKYYHELQNEASIYANKVSIVGEKLLELHADELLLSGNNLETLSRRTQTVEGKVTTIEGTGVYQNSEHITQVAGNFSIERNDQGEIVGIKVIEGSKFSVEKDGVYSEVVGQNGMNSAIAQSASQIRLEVENSISAVQASIELTEDSIRSDVSAANSHIYSSIEQTASSIRMEVENSISAVQASIELTEDSIRSDVSAANSMIYSSIEQTASAIRMEVENSISAVQASIELTEDSIRSDVSAANSTIYSSIEQTASAIRSALVDTESGLYNYIQSTASGTRQMIISKSSRTWIQDTDPRTEAGGSHEAKAGDIWVESTHHGTWDGAEGFNWEHDEGYDWTQIQGAKIWGWQNNKWELISDQQQVVSYSDVINTAEHYVNLKIAGLANDEGLLDVYMSKIEQTATEIRSEISDADSTIFSFIHQTRSNILLRVAEQPRYVYSKDEPTEIVDGEVRRNIKNGDIWVKTENSENWDAMLENSWGDEVDIDWGALRQDTIKIYKDGRWVDILDGTTIVDDADIAVEKNTVKMYARKLEQVDGELQRYYAELKVDAHSIRSQVDEIYNGLGSRITQTAREIRADVYAENSKVYSAITQTASNIKMEVANTISGVQASFEVTASSIRSDVSAANSRIYSSITQTASSIRLEVASAKSSLSSSITMTASSIRSEVNAANSKIYSSITQTASSIRLEVASAKSSLSSSITMTASSIRSEVNAAKSQIYSSITQTASSIRLEVASAKSSLSSSITMTASSIRADVSAANSRIYSSIVQTASGIRSDVVSAISNYKSLIKQQADRISLVVSGTGSEYELDPAKIVTGINSQTGSYVKISAKTIDLRGYVTASELDAEWLGSMIADLDAVNMREAHATELYIGTEDDDINDLFDDRQVSDITVNGNTMTITYVSTSGRQPVTFSKATSLSGTWSGTVAAGKSYKVTASPQGTVHYSPQLDGIIYRNDKTWASNKKSFTQTLYVYDEDGEELYEENLSFSTTDSYNKGHDDGYDVAKGYVTMPSAGTGTTFKVQVPNDARNGKDDRTFEITKGTPSASGGYASVKYNNNVVARISLNNWWEGGYNAGYDANHSMFIGDAEAVAQTTLSVTPGSPVELWPYFLKSDDKTYQWGTKCTVSAVDRYNDGYDDNHSMFIGDAEGVAIPSSKPLSPGQSIEVWPYFKKKAEGYQWGPKYTFSATNPHPRKVSMTCTAKSKVNPQSTIYNYTFTAQTAYSFNTGSSTDFYY